MPSISPWNSRLQRRLAVRVIGGGSYRRGPCAASQSRRRGTAEARRTRSLAEEEAGRNRRCSRSGLRRREARLPLGLPPFVLFRPPRGSVSSAVWLGLYFLSGSRIFSARLAGTARYSKSSMAKEPRPWVAPR